MYLLAIGELSCGHLNCLIYRFPWGRSINATSELVHKGHQEDNLRELSTHRGQQEEHSQ